MRQAVVVAAASVAAYQAVLGCGVVPPLIAGGGVEEHRAVAASRRGWASSNRQRPVGEASPRNLGVATSQGSDVDAVSVCR
jgi:hypothetical protein